MSADSNPGGLPPLLNVIALATFAASLTNRALDPVLPHIAEDFALTIATAASLSSAVAFTFAIVQPLLGAAADFFGKASLVIGCLILLAAANLVGALAPNFSVLFVSRIVGGVAAGGIFPIAMALASDMVVPEKRQLAIGRLLTGSMSGNLLGASLAGVIGDFLGWRGVLAVLCALVIVASAAVAVSLRGQTLGEAASPTGLRNLLAGYRAIFANPNAPACFTAVLIEGCCIFGLFPFIAAFLIELGEPRLSIAGVVIAGFAIGGLFYSLTVSRLLPTFGVRGMMTAGAALVAAQLLLVGFGPPWGIQLPSLILMGWGFYMIHGCIQVFASDLSVEARATALALHSFFFFLGQTAGPIAYGFGVSHWGKMPTLAIAAAAFLTLGLIWPRWLKPVKAADA